MVPLRRARPLALILAGACSADAPPAPVTRVAPTTRVAPATPPITDAGAPVAEAPPPFSVAGPLPPTVGVIVAQQPGATVALHPEHGPALALADGERVTYIDDSAGMGEHDTQVGATATVEARGVRGTVPNARVVTEARLHRAPRGGAAIFAAIYLCGDFCSAEVWLLAPAGRRARITRDAGPAVAVAWRPDGERVAIASRGLHVVDVASGRVEVADELTAPAYAPDGALFARGAREDDAVFALADGAAPRRVFAAPGRPPARVMDLARAGRASRSAAGSASARRRCGSAPTASDDDAGRRRSRPFLPSGGAALLTTTTRRRSGHLRDESACRPTTEGSSSGYDLALESIGGLRSP